MKKFFINLWNTLTGKNKTGGSNPPVYSGAIARNFAIEKAIEASVEKNIGNKTALLQHNASVQFWKNFFKAMAVAESGLNPTTRLVEQGLGKDAVTGQQNTSEGLTQMSYQDSKFHGCNFDWSVDKNKDPKDPTKTIFDVDNNISCAMIVLNKQLSQGKKLYSQYYWSVLNPERSGHARFLKALDLFESESGNDHPEAVDEITDKTPWMQIAIDEIGVKEYAGSKHNARIVEYHSVTSLKAKDDETAWCASFVSWCLEKAGIKSTKSAWARDYLNWGKKITTPVKGCIVVFDRGNGYGHVGFFIEEKNGFVKTLGGNQNNQVCYSNYNKSKVLGYRLP